MNRDDILQLAKILGLSYGSTRGKNILMQCPLAPYSSEHAHSVDKEPSWSVKVDEGGRSVCNCFGCGKKGTVVWFLERAEAGYKVFADALAFAKEAEKHFDLRKALDEKLSRDKPLAPQSFALSRFVRACSRLFPNYALKRGLSHSEIGTWMLGHDILEDRMTFPVWDGEGALVGVVGRTLDDSVAPKYRNYFGFNTGAHFYGEHRIDMTVDEAVLVEGPLDVIVGRRNHPNVLGNIGLRTVFTAMKRDWLKKRFRSVTIMFDPDPAGDSARQGIARWLSKVVLVNVASLPLKKDPSDDGGVHFVRAMKKKVPWFLQGLTNGK